MCRIHSLALVATSEKLLLEAAKETDGFQTLSWRRDALIAFPRRGIVNASHQENAAGGYSHRSATIGLTFIARRAGR